MAKKDKNTEYILLPDKNAWMTTFSDMVTLLITFFVLLISMSSMDSKAMREMFGFFNEAMGPLDFAQVQEIQGLPTLMEAVPPKVFLDSLSLSRNILNSLEKNGSGGFSGRGKDIVEVRESNRGLAIMLNGDVLFDEGSSELRKEAPVVLQSIADTVKDADSTISIEGHTDNQGDEHGLYRLSLQRAISVLDFFVYTSALSPTRFCVAGYGPARPVDTNATSQGRAKNRRVEIILLKQRI
ncbi:MAG: flagellar motor protein MotB [Deltaproteobacteria bacterium]|nr:flagellar motor protein MotB [Deltaproteobacteria bacterium]